MTRTRRMLTIAIAALASAAIGAAGCGGEDDDALVGGDTDGATVPGGEVRDEGVGVLDGVRYRVVLVRPLNLELQPDRSIYGGPAPDGRRQLQLAVVRACDVADGRRRPSADIRLQDAFGETFERKPPPAGDVLAYRARTLPPGGCEPRAGSVAARTLDGAALVYEVPLRSVRERPLVLEVVGDDGRLRLPASPPAE